MALFDNRGGWLGNVFRVTRRRRGFCGFVALKNLPRPGAIGSVFLSQRLAVFRGFEWGPLEHYLPEGGGEI